MTTMNDFNYVDDSDDVMAVHINNLNAAALRSEFKNIETLSANRTLLDVDTPLQRFDGNGSNWNILMPAANLLENHPYLIVNASSGSEVLTVKSNDGTVTFATLEADDKAFLLPDGDGGYMLVNNLTPAASGGVLPNHLINPGFDRFERASSASMTDDVYNAPDRWYSLVQGAGATIEQGPAIGTSKYSCKITAGGTTNRYGFAQIEENRTAVGRRGKTVNAQIRIMPVNNAGSGSRDYRIAILEWTGTADTVTSEIVNDWTSSNFTTGNFFASTSLTLVATGSLTIAHNTEDVLSVTGTVSTSCNNLIVFVWVEDVPTHASDYALFGEAGSYDTSTEQIWTPPDPVQDTTACLRRFFSRGGATNYEPVGDGFCYSTTLAQIFVQFPVEMASVPTLGYSAVGDWALRRAAAFSTATAITINNASKKTAELYVTVSSGLTAQDATMLLGNNTSSARLTFNAEL